MSTSTTTDPSVEDVEGYNTEILIAYLQNQRILNLTGQHINVLRENEVAGYDFLRLKQEDLERYGLKNQDRQKEYQTLPFRCVTLKTTTKVNGDPLTDVLLLLWDDFLKEVNQFHFNQQLRFKRLQFSKDRVMTNEEDALLSLQS
ncbi:6611_t:CDS:2 [Paraglomus brasilianum]|uniref:6611_t:CDS:1 n=1 Tax=Paraglomus brasilianum TaxID=144538 RepID=A0A9N9FTX1_9GLOM|nr:6611_t:CDS:2 [Paraglomus brasilianum]